MSPTQRRFTAFQFCYAWEGTECTFEGRLNRLQRSFLEPPLAIRTIELSEIGEQERDERVVSTRHVNTEICRYTMGLRDLIDKVEDRNESRQQNSDVYFAFASTDTEKASRY